MNGYIGLAVASSARCSRRRSSASTRLLGVHFDLVLVAVICWTALRRFEDGLVWAVLGGLGLDLFSALPIGTSVAALR